MPFHAVEVAFNLVAVRVPVRIKGNFLFSIRMAWNDHFYLLLGAISPVFVAIIARVGDDPLRFQALEQGQRLRAVTGLASGGNQAHGVTERVDAGVDFGAVAPATAPQTGIGGLLRRLLFF